jgi:hypothetical protein
LVPFIRRNIAWSFYFLLAFLGCQGIAQTLHAQQFAFDYWHEGKVVLEGNDTLKGMIKYNMQNDLVQLDAHNKLETFTARKILFFEIFDKTVKRYRQFYSLPYASGGQYKTPVFFELLAEGKMTLLAREALEYKTYSSYYYYGSYTRLVVVNKYFFLKEDGRIVDFSGKKNDFLELTGAHENDVQSFIKSNKLDFDDKYNLSKAAEYYNSFFK